MATSVPDRRDLSALCLLALSWGSCASVGFWLAAVAPEVPFPRELGLLLILQGAAAGLFLAIRSLLARVFLHAFRGLMLSLSLLILGPRYPLAAAVVMLPFVLDSALRFRRPAALGFLGPFVGLALLAVAASAPGGQAASRFDAAFLFLLAAAAAVLGFVYSGYRERLVGLGRRASVLTESVARLTNSNLALQSYADSAALRSEVGERNRITRELHDSVGYALTNINMMMQAAKVLLQTDPQRLGGFLDQVREQTDLALGESRRILHSLRAMEAGGPTGTDALRQLVATCSLAMGIEVDLVLGNYPPTFGEELDGALYRFVQEGLTNAFRHGRATRIRIVCQKTDREILMSLTDNGVGASQVIEGIGTKGMRERLAPFAGTVEGENIPGGYRISVSIPIGRQP